MRRNSLNFKTNKKKLSFASVHQIYCYHLCILHCIRGEGLLLKSCPGSVMYSHKNKHSAVFFNLPFLTIYLHPLQHYHIPAFSVWMNLSLRASNVYRLHSQNNAMNSNIRNKINQFSLVAFNSLYIYQCQWSSFIADLNILKCSLLWQCVAAAYFVYR